LKAKIGERERSKGEGYMLLERERGRAQTRTLYNISQYNKLDDPSKRVVLGKGCRRRKKI